MSNRYRYSHARFWLTYPPILLLVYALCLLWPSKPTPARILPGPFVSRITYVGQVAPGHSPFAFSRMNLMARSERVAPLLDEVFDKTGYILPRYRADARPMITAEQPLADRALGSIKEFEPIPMERPVFSAPQPGEPSVTIKAGGSLASRGFHVSDWPIAQFKEIGKSWVATVHVEVDEEGHVSHVFLEEPCREAKVNAILVRSIAKGSIKHKGPACNGRVVASFNIR